MTPKQEHDLYVDERLIPINDEYNRVAKAIDDYEWEGDYIQADLYREELRFIDALKLDGDVYVPRFQGGSFNISCTYSVWSWDRGDMTDEDPHDDWTTGLSKLPKQSVKSTEHTTERVAGRTQPPDNQRKKPPKEEGQ